LPALTSSSQMPGGCPGGGVIPVIPDFLPPPRLRPDSSSSLVSFSFFLMAFRAFLSSSSVAMRPPMARRARRVRAGSIRIRADDFSSLDGAERPPDHTVDRGLGEPHAAVGEQGVHAAGVVAPGRERPILRLVLADQDGQDVEVCEAGGIDGRL